MFNGGVLGISNDDIKKRELFVEDNEIPSKGSGPPFPSPVYVWDREIAWYHLVQVGSGLPDS